MSEPQNLPELVPATAHRSSSAGATSSDPYFLNYREGRGMTTRAKTSSLAVLWLAILISMTRMHAAAIRAGRVTVLIGNSAILF